MGWQIYFGVMIFVLGFIVGGCVAKKIWGPEND